MSSLLQYLNPTPTFPSFSGPYSVGTQDLEIPISDLPQTVQKPDIAPSTIAFRLYHPCQKPATPSKPVRWIPKPQYDQLTSVWRFLGIGPSLSSWLAYALPHLTRVSIPAHRDAPLASPDSDTSSDKDNSDKKHRWPVLIFSHGLGGSRNYYSYLCGSLAAHGIVVAAPDHRDGSQTISFVRSTQEKEAEQLHYKILKHQPCDETFTGRDLQLKIRIWETAMLLEALHIVNDGTRRLQNLHHTPSDTAEPDTRLDQFSSALDLSPGTVSFAGHSFGGTTVVQLLKSVYYRHHDIHSSLFTPSPEITPALTPQITPTTPAILLDPWGLPLTNPAQSALSSKPMPAYTCTSDSADPPLLTILSQAFYNWRSNRDEVIAAVSPPTVSPPTSSSSQLSPSQQQKQPLIFYPAASAHLSQSDFGLAFPRLTKYLAHAAEPRRLLDLNVRAVLALLRRRGIAVSAFDLAAAGEIEDAEGWVDLGDGDEKEDEILSREGGVRGWNYVAPDEQVVEEVGDEDARRMGKVEGMVVHGRKRSDVGEDEMEGLAESGKWSVKSGVW